MVRKWVLGQLLVLMICVLYAPAVGFAKTGYVSDSLILTLREGPGNEYAVIQSLGSDTPVTILEERERYYKVQLSSGKTGWVDGQYIVFEPTKQMRIDQLQKEKQELEERLVSMKSALEKGRTSLTLEEETKQKLKDELVQAKQANEKFQKDLDAAGKAYEELKNNQQDIANLLEQNKTLTQANGQLIEKIKILKKAQKGKFSFLTDPALIKWFLAGVGVLLLGWILGHSVSSGKERRNSLLD